MCVRSSATSYGSFNLDMDRSPGFGSAPYDFIRPIKTWFPFGSVPGVLNLATRRNSPDRSTKSTRLHLHRASTACKHRVSGSLSLRSRGSFHLSFTVLCSIGHWVVFSLRGWSPFLPTRFLVSRCTLDPACYCQISDTWLSHFFADFPKSFSYLILALRSPNPTVFLLWFRLFRFRSPLLPKSMFLSLPRPT